MVRASCRFFCDTALWLALLCCGSPVTPALAESSPAPASSSPETAQPPANPGIPEAEASTASDPDLSDTAAQLAAEDHTAPQPEHGSRGLDKSGQAHWQTLEEGLAFGEFRLNDSEAGLTVLRIDPEYYDFRLYSRSQDGGPARTLGQWGEEHDLTAAINASMYLPDGSTSTGYMRQGEHYNNKRLVQRFGAFFVAGPRKDGLPKAAIIDRDEDGWQNTLDAYETVIQNYRMINAGRRILWSPGGPLYSISAVAQDETGQILFLHCRQPVEAYAFAQQVLHLPLNIRTVMYVEGGAQAGLLVRSQALSKELGGAHAASFVTGDLKALLPNVLGVRRRSASGTASTPAARP